MQLSARTSTGLANRLLYHHSHRPDGGKHKLAVPEIEKPDLTGKKASAGLQRRSAFFLPLGLNRATLTGKLWQ